MNKLNYDNFSSYRPPKERSSLEAINHDIKRISKSEIVNAILENTGGIVAVLDVNRQVIGVNHKLLEKLKIENREDVFGLRPGEVFNCIHSIEEDGGCGHSKYCPTCGAAIAISLAQIEKEPIERICVVSLKKDNDIEEVYFKVRANTFFHEGRWYILLFLQDYTDAQRRASLEKIFYHDIGNIVNGLAGSAQILTSRRGENSSEDDSINYIIDSAMQLSREILLHRAMQEKDAQIYHKSLEKASIKSIIDKAVSIIQNSSSAKDKTIVVSEAPEFEMYLDITVVIKILCNMLKNALEADNTKNEIEIWAELGNQDGNIKFHVWNDAFIPKEIQYRIFQKNFSTNPELGRGFGTFSMRFFARELLDGDVYFQTSKKEGTKFTLNIPLI
ncbi:MAG: sensor histidine kinase [Candidatus Zixiibacteriota bacterium]